MQYLYCTIEALISRRGSRVKHSTHALVTSAGAGAGAVAVAESRIELNAESRGGGAQEELMRTTRSGAPEEEEEEAAAGTESGE